MYICILIEMGSCSFECYHLSFLIAKLFRFVAKLILSFTDTISARMSKGVALALLMIAVAFRPFIYILASNNLRYIHTMSCLSSVNFVVTYVSTHLVS